MFVIKFPDTGNGEQLVQLPDIFRLFAVGYYFVCIF